MKKIFLYSFALFLSLSAFSCANDVELKPAPALPSGEFFSSSLINVENPGSEMSTFSKEKQVVKLKLSLPASEENYTPEAISVEDKLDKIVRNYALYKKLKATEYTLLPPEHYSITATEIEAGKKESEISVELKDFNNIAYGKYMLPVVFKVNEQVFMHLIDFEKEGEYSALSDTNKKALPKTGSRTEPMKLIAFCEINDWDPRNFANLVLKDSKKPVFDIVVFFAANMNYNAIEGKRYLFFNDKFQPIVNNPDAYIKYIKDRGIKVIVDILPNHQGVGFENFQSKEEAVEFAKDLKYWVDKLGFDGYDLDEEYANYGVVPSLVYKRESAQWFVEAYKEVMPDKLLTLYEFGFPHGNNYDKYFDYSWANYGVPGSSYGISAHKHTQYSIEANYDPYISNAYNSANSNLRSGNLGLMFFNIHGSRMQNVTFLSNLSRVTQLYYGEDAVFEGRQF